MKNQISPDPAGRPFSNLYSHNLGRTALAIPKVRVADPMFNAAQTISLMKEAVARKALLAVFPELGLSAYSCEDLFHQQALLDGCLDALGEVIEASRKMPLIVVVGLPVGVDHLLFNCAAVLHRGRLLGVAPKTYLPNYREFYELRQFTPGDYTSRQSVDLCGFDDVPFGTRLLFRMEEQPLLTFFVEICEDLWAPVPPSSFAAMAGASVLINLSASPVTIGKDGYRRQLAADQSGRCIAAYIHCGAGFGESTTDLAWDGHGMIFEKSSLLAETRRFSYDSQIITGDIDLDRLAQDRMRQNSFNQALPRHRETLATFRTISFSAALPTDRDLPLDRLYDRFPSLKNGIGGQELRASTFLPPPIIPSLQGREGTSVRRVQSL